MKRFLIKVLKPLAFVPALCMLFVIFGFSAQSGKDSSRMSLKVTETVVSVVDKAMKHGWDESERARKVESYHFYVRKAAHMTEYCILAITIALPLYVYGLRGFLLLFVAGGACVLTAAGDEYHQSFVAGRGPSVRDVLIDSGGALIGVFLTQVFSWIALGGKKHMNE